MSMTFSVYVSGRPENLMTGSTLHVLQQYTPGDWSGFSLSFKIILVKIFPCVGHLLCRWNTYTATCGKNVFFKINIQLGMICSTQI